MQQRARSSSSSLEPRSRRRSPKQRQRSPSSSLEPRSRRRSPHEQLRSPHWSNGPKRSLDRCVQQRQREPQDDGKQDRECRDDHSDRGNRSGRVNQGRGERRAEPRGGAAEKPKEEPRVLEARATLPLTLKYVVPKGFRRGQPLTVQGPHGPMRLPVPQGVQPGDEFSFRLGPPGVVVPVPEGKRPGDQVQFEDANGKPAVAVVPPGLKEGDIFEVMPPVLMVQMPKGAVCGDKVSFCTPESIEVTALVPKGVSPGQYFPAYYAGSTQQVTSSQ